MILPNAFLHINIPIHLCKYFLQASKSIYEISFKNLKWYMVHVYCSLFHIGIYIYNYGAR